MALSPQDVEAAQATQEAAAHAGQAQVRLVAGPGTGKSSTIEERVCWLLREGLDPANIAVVSFTNASVIDLSWSSLCLLQRPRARRHQGRLDHDTAFAGVAAPEASGTA